MQPSQPFAAFSLRRFWDEGFDNMLEQEKTWYLLRLIAGLGLAAVLAGGSCVACWTAAWATAL